MSIIRITVNDQDLVCTSKPVIASQGVEEDAVAFLFSSEWDGMGKVATFFNIANKDEVYTSVVDADGEAVVPWEVTQTEGAFYIGVYGVSGDTIYTSNLLRYTLEKGIYTVGQESEPPTPDIVAQLLSYAGGALAAVADETANRVSADTDLSNRIDVVNSRVDETVSVFGVDSVETTLYTGVARYSGTTYTLEEDASNYSYLDLYINAYGKRSVRTIPVTASRYDVVALNLADYVEGQTTGQNPLIEGAEFQVSVSGTTFSIDNHTYYRNNSAVAGDPVAGQAADAPTSDLTNVAGWIEKIVGRKVAGNTELADIRVGANGTTYDTAGTAVRTQITNTESKASTANESIRQSIKEHDGYDILTFVPGGYYPIATIGATVDLTTFTASVNYLHAYAACSEGDVFTVNIHGGTAGARAYAWLNASYEILSRTNTSYNYNGILIAPANAAYLVINTKSAIADFYAFKGSVSAKDPVPMNKSGNTVQSGGVYLANNRIEKSIGEYGTDITPEYTSGQVWKIVNGKAEYTAVSGYAAFEAVAATPGEKYSMMQMYNGNENFASAVVTDGSYNILAAYSGTPAIAETIEFYIPNGAVYLLLSSTASTAGNVVLKKLTLSAGAALGVFSYPGKNIAIIGDSISTNGNYSVSNPQGNMPEIVIGADDVGVSLSAYVTYYDIGTTVGGHTIAASEVGTEITFTPAAGDVGKFVGVPKNNNAASTVTWWEVAQEKLGFNVIPVCWSGSSITSHEGTDDELKTSYAWHPAQIRKCGIRTPGSMDRTAPDMIIVFRGANDFSHTPYTKLTDGYFNASWTYPDTDVIADGFGFLEGICLTVKKLREAYPKARIVLCTLNYFQRFNSTRPGYPTRNGINTLNQYNDAVRAAANWLGCGLIEFDKDGLTYENASSEYYNETTGNYTHPNTAGQRFLGMRAINDLNRIND